MDRFSRNTSLVPRTIEQENILIVGAGAIGKQVCISLAAMGAKHMEIFDFDNVDETNISTQAFRVQDIGHNKARIVAEMCKSLDFEHNANIIYSEEQWSPSRVKINPTVVFSCVDSMEAREALFNYFKRSNINAFFDMRMLGENMYVFSMDRTEKLLENYEKTLFSDEEADPGRCTARSTIYAASIAGNFAVQQFSRYLRKVELEPNLGLNLTEMEFHKFKI